MRFRDVVNGTVGDGPTFLPTTDPGTITITSTSPDPAVKLNTYFTNGHGIGGDVTDGDPWYYL